MTPRDDAAKNPRCPSIEHCVPNSGRSTVQDSQSTECGLAFKNAMPELAMAALPSNRLWGPSAPRLEHTHEGVARVPLAAVCGSQQLRPEIPKVWKPSNRPSINVTALCVPPSLRPKPLTLAREILARQPDRHRNIELALRRKAARWQAYCGGDEPGALGQEQWT